MDASARLGDSLDILEVRECFDVPVAVEDLVECQALKAAGAEVLDAERPHDAAEDDGAAERRSVQRRLLGQVTEEATGEAITGAGGIDLILQRIRGHGEDVVVV